MVQTQVDMEGRPGVVTFDRIDWSLSPLQLTVHNLLLLDREGQPALEAKRVSITPNTEQSHHKKRDFAIVAPMVVVEDFNLNLRWNKHGRLELSEAFRSRSFDWKEQKRPPRKLRIETPQVILKRGNLTLDWPAFALHFSGIDTGGTVSILQKDLTIQVDTLSAESSTLQLKKPSKALRKRLKTLATNSTPLNGLELPTDAVHITDFNWDDDGFNTALKLGDTNQKHVHITGKMHFLDDGIHHELKGNIALPAPWAQSVSNQSVQGPLQLAFSTKGVDLSGNGTVQNVRLDKAVVGSTTIEHLQIPSATVDTSQEALVLSGTARARTLGGGRLNATNVSSDIRASIGWPGWKANAFFKEVSKSPKSLLKRFTIFGAPKANMTLSSARADAVSFRAASWKDVQFNELSVTGKLRSLEGHLTSCTTGSGQEIKASLQSGLLSIALDITHSRTPASVLSTLYGSRSEWKDQGSTPLNTTVTMRSSITNPLSFDVNKVAVEDVP